MTYDYLAAVHRAPLPPCLSPALLAVAEQCEPVLAGDVLTTTRGEPPTWARQLVEQERTLDLVADRARMMRVLFEAWRVPPALVTT